MGEQPGRGRRISKIGEKVIHYDIKSPILDNNYPGIRKIVIQKERILRIPETARLRARPPGAI